MIVAEFIGSVARPFAIIWATLCGGIAMIIMALRVENGNDAGVLMGAITLCVGGIYGFKAVETWKAVKADADVKIAEAGK